MVVADIDEGAVKGVAVELPSSGRGVPYTGDVRDADAVAELARWARAELGPVRLLVANAGLQQFGYLWEIPVVSWQRVFNLAAPSCSFDAALVFDDRSDDDRYLGHTDGPHAGQCLRHPRRRSARSRDLIRLPGRPDDRPRVHRVAQHHLRDVPAEYPPEAPLDVR